MMVSSWPVTHVHCKNLRGILGLLPARQASYHSLISLNMLREIKDGDNRREFN